MAMTPKMEYKDKYVFLAEWYNSVAEVTKEFLLSFYPHDETLDLYDTQYRRSFLRRTKVDGIHLMSLYKGAVVTIFCRQIKVVDYANEITKLAFSVGLQKIFLLIKPDGVAKAADIITFMERNSFKLTRLKMGRLTRDGVHAFFCKSKLDPPLHHDFDAALTIGPCIAIEAIGEDGVSRWLKAVGPEDPIIARAEAPDSLRAIHGGCSVIHNAIHTSTDSSDYEREAEIWFSKQSCKQSLIEPSFLCSNTTCCIIKPHAVSEGIVGEIINYITDKGFHVTAMELFCLDQATAEDFYEVYKGVVPEYSGMVTQLTSGPCVVLEIANNNGSSTAQEFRQVAGPTDPVSARSIRPDSLRAKFGTTTVLNAIHCTDLPEDAELELKYFFDIIQQ